jgi:hypothetical protein
MWCVAELNAEYIKKMEDVLATYEKPYDCSQPVVCLDEKPISLHDDLRAPLPMAPGRIAKRDNEYKRCGTANVFCVVAASADPRRSSRLHPSTAELATFESSHFNQHDLLVRVHDVRPFI